MTIDNGCEDMRALSAEEKTALLVLLRAKNK